MWGYCTFLTSFFCFLQGYFLLFESMLDSVLYAKNKYLAKGGSGEYKILALITYFSLAEPNEPLGFK